MKRGRQGEGGGHKWFKGRPEESILSLLRQAWAIGCPDCEAASLADISASVLSKYLSSHPEVEQEKARLLEKPFLIARNAMLKQMQLGDGDLALKYMERKRKAEFSTLQQIEVGEQGQYKDFTDEQLAQIATGKATPADFLK